MNRWHLVILVYICFIYGNSLTPSNISSQESGFMLVKIQDLMGSMGLEHQWMTEHMIRKTAHFVEYAVLGGLIVQVFGLHSLCGSITKNADRRQDIQLLRNVFSIVLLVPFADETIQLFVPGRSGQISDVWLDMSGEIFGMVITVGIAAWMSAWRKRGQKGREV